MCNARGWREEEVYKTWTFRRVLHAFLTLQGERNAPFVMLLNAFAGDGRGARTSHFRGGRSGQRLPPYDFWQAPMGRRGARKLIRAFHVEDPLALIGSAIPVGKAAPYKREGHHVERLAHPLAGVGKKRNSPRPR